MARDILAERLRAIVTTHLPSATRDSDDVFMTRRSLLSLLGQAARIGAELEREECARFVANYVECATDEGHDIFPDEIAMAIHANATRARSNRL